MSYNPTIKIPLEEPIRLTKEVTLTNGEKSTIKMACDEVSLTQRELDYINNPPHDLSVDINNVEKISNWHDYAKSASNGEICLHFRGLTMVRVAALPTSSDCIHNKFGSIQLCIRKLLLTLYGAIFDYTLFSENQLCRQCLLYFCSHKRIVEKLFSDYYNDYAILFDHDDSFVRCKELLYFGNCLLKYHMVVKFILSNPILYTKLFDLFVYYLKAFDSIKINFNSPLPCMLNVSEHNYVIFSLGIANACQFEYNFCGIMCCMKQIMPYFQRKHLQYLINKNYFKYFMNFIDQFLNMEYMKILTNSIKKTNNLGDLHSIDLTSTCLMDLLLCVNGFLSELIFRKFKNIAHTLKQKFKAKIFQISKSRDKTYILARYSPHLFFNYEGKLKREFKYHYMCFGISIQTYFNVESIFEDKRKQLRMHKRCNCNNKGHKKHLKLCRQCKLTYYCNVKCQKNDWKYHKQCCKLFNQLYL
eukprot:391368_1